MRMYEYYEWARITVAFAFASKRRFGAAKASRDSGSQNNRKVTVTLSEMLRARPA